MDEIVLRGMAKWPNVPAVYGWLSLDRRGQWLIKGERISNPLVTEFIGRNFACDERGCWYFQNGPQRVFVDLDYTPRVYRVVSAGAAPLALETSTGSPVSTVRGAWIDETGTPLFDTEHGIGAVHDRDLERLLAHFTGATGAPLSEDALEELMGRLQQGKEAPLWLRYRGASVRVAPIRSETVAQRFGFRARPEAPAGEEVCR
ncbi:MAG TPA: DUF2946 family protein [Burkholderiales bacterium]|jgi:hypothetical protein|nr:DUF2946 family protein [Burkholderiales bacterium]